MPLAQTIDELLSRVNDTQLGREGVHSDLLRILKSTFHTPEEIEKSDNKDDNHQRCCNANTNSQPSS